MSQHNDSPAFIVDKDGERPMDKLEAPDDDLDYSVLPTLTLDELRDDIAHIQPSALNAHIIHDYAKQLLSMIDSRASVEGMTADDHLIVRHLLEYRRWYTEEIFSRWTLEEAKAVHAKFPGAVDRIAAESARKTLDTMVADIRAGKHRTWKDATEYGHHAVYAPSAAPSDSSIQAAARHYFCSCGGALTAEEYIEHYFEKGHDQGEPQLLIRAAAAEISSTFGLKFQEASLAQVAAIIAKHLGSAAVGEPESDSK